MTLLDLIRLLGRHWKLCVILPIICALACAGVLNTRSQEVSYSASSRIVTSSSGQLATLNGAASSASNVSAAESVGCSVSVKVDTASYSVKITVSGSDSAKVVEVANEIADTAVEDAYSLLGEDKLSAKVQAATSSVASSGPPRAVLVFVALLVGLFLAICIIVGIDAVRRPVKSSSDLLESSGLPVLGVLPGDAANLLLANVRFVSSKAVPHSVLVVPAHEQDAANTVKVLIEQAISEESPAEVEAHGGPMRVSASAPLTQTIATAYEARDADAVLLAAEQWDDSLADIDMTMRELKFAGANVVGCVLVNSAKSGTKRKERA